MIFVKRAPLGGHRLVARPRLGHHHHHRVRQLAARQRQELEDVVEHRRVGSLGIDDGQHLLQVITEELGPHHRLARMHPVDVAAQGIDLPVVRNVSIGMRPRPRGESIRGKPRMDHRQRGRQRGVFQIQIKLS